MSTPLGSFSVTEKLSPHPYKLREETPQTQVEDLSEFKGQNPYGSRFLRFAPEYGVHGTPPFKESLIPGEISHGCVRMKKKDVEELYDLIKLGVPVRIVRSPVSVDVLQKARQQIARYE
jgi:lipoprotein-anchoring transpeptidase ErfK/SrfK